MMRAKKISILVAVFVFTSLLLAGAASADWYKCTITQVGASAGASVVVLTHVAANPAFTNRMFALNPNTSKEQLAIALTAYANGKSLKVNLSTITAGSTITTAYVLD